MSKILVAYFSASGVTKKVAEKLAALVNADIHEIKPKVPYTKADLNWMDKTFRPEIVKEDLNLSSYDTILLGFPIWWYVAPTIINTFLENYDFSGKRIVLFATSGGSGFGNTIKELKPSVADAEIVEGKILNRASDDQLKDWIAGL